MIEDRIPHRAPFLWIDRVELLKEGARCVAYKQIDPAAPFFAGHFPARPMLPGVFLIEAVAQTAGVMLGGAGGEGIALLASVNRFKFLKPVEPGAELRIETKLLTAQGKLAIVEGSVEVEGELVARGELTVARP
jgi:3-hydroxyacyl-[acyl-carrier-protein] dehydratase